MDEVREDGFLEALVEEALKVTYILHIYLLN